MKWVGHLARVGERRSAYRVLVGKPEGKNHLEGPGIDGRIILKWISMKWDVWACSGLICLRIVTGIGGRLWMR